MPACAWRACDWPGSNAFNPTSSRGDSNSVLFPILSARHSAWSAGLITAGCFTRAVYTRAGHDKRGDQLNFATRVRVPILIRPNAGAWSKSHGVEIVRIGSAG